jgi:hypothetical protein
LRGSALAAFPSEHKYKRDKTVNNGEKIMKFWKTENWKSYLLSDGSGYIDRSPPEFTLLQKGCEFYSPWMPDKRGVLLLIANLAKQYGVKRIQTDSLIKSYLNISGLTCVVDPFGAHPSKGHKSAIKKGRSLLTCETSTDIKTFMHDYFVIAGHQTRPVETFEFLGKWIKSGYGTLLRASADAETAGYIYILHYQDEAYYFMSGVFSQYKMLNVSHFLQDKAFELLRNMDIRYYELGEQHYPSIFYVPTEKEESISLFKRGFGGQIVAKPRSEFFFDANYLKTTHENRIIKYTEALK